MDPTMKDMVGCVGEGRGLWDSRIFLFLFSASASGTEDWSLEVGWREGLALANIPIPIFICEDFIP